MLGAGARVLVAVERGVMARERLVEANGRVQS